jgi:hypothetical protein
MKPYGCEEMYQRFNDCYRACCDQLNGNERETVQRGIEQPVISLVIDHVQREIRNGMNVELG